MALQNIYVRALDNAKEQGGGNHVRAGYCIDQSYFDSDGRVVYEYQPLLPGKGVLIMSAARGMAAAFQPSGE